MNRPFLSFEEFIAAQQSAVPAKVYSDGIEIDGRRFNDRKLRVYLGETIKASVSVLGRLANCFTLDGWFICIAAQKLYFNEIVTFQRALDFEPSALRRLHQRPGWHGKPWHVHLAQVRMDCLMEESNYDALPETSSF